MMENNFNPAAQMMRMPMSGMNLMNMITPGGFPNAILQNTRLGVGLNEQQQKKKEFSRGIFVSGFQKSVTTAMLQKHFNIKQIFGLKHPLTKLKESKGFAFIYYGSEDDAVYVKKTLDRSSILHDKIRITRTVISENISKMMIKLKTVGLTQKEINENETKYFNDENLEKEVQRIIKPLFGSSVEVNKVTIPHSKKEKKPLRYARISYYVSDIKQGSRIARTGLAADNPNPIPGKEANEYQNILNFINELLRRDQTFSKNCTAEIYEYTKKSLSNVMHIKGIKYNKDQVPAVIADELKQFFQKQNPQWNIINTYVAYFSRGAWANITFATYEETIQAYELLKNARPKFRDSVIYGSLRNVKDSRTVVVSVVRKDADENNVKKLLDQLAAQSPKNPNQQVGDEVGSRKYDYFSFNIVEAKRFYRNDNNESQGVEQGQFDQVKDSWVEINEVPRRLIVHFFNEFTEQDIKELTNNIRILPSYENIFLIGDSKKQLRSNHQKGHVNRDGVYIKHTEIKKKKVRTQNTRPGFKPRFNNQDPNQMRNRNKNFDFKMFPMGGIGGMPKGLGQGPYRPSAPNMGGNLPFLNQGLPGSANLPGMLPTQGLPGTLPPGISANLPGTMRPGMGPTMPFGSQPPAVGGFKPGMPGMPGMPGFSGMPGMPGMLNTLPPGMNMPPGTGPLNMKPPGTGPNPTFQPTYVPKPPAK